MYKSAFLTSAQSTLKTSDKTYYTKYTDTASQA